MEKILSGNWFAPRNYLKNLKSTIEVDFICQSSSSGDWTGYVIKKVGRTFKLFLFYQENLGGGRGMKLFLENKPLATKKNNFEEQDLNMILSDLY